MAMPEDVSALHLVPTGDPALFAIVRLSLVVNLSAVMFAALIGVPFGALIAPTSFRGREIAIVVLNALMGLPPASRRGQALSAAVYFAVFNSGDCDGSQLVPGHSHVYQGSAQTVEQGSLQSPRPSPSKDLEGGI